MLADDKMKGARRGAPAYVRPYRIPWHLLGWLAASAPLGHMLIVQDLHAKHQAPYSAVLLALERNRRLECMHFEQQAGQRTLGVRRVDRGDAPPAFGLSRL